MVKVEKTEYGFKLILEGQVTPHEMAEAEPAIRRAVANRKEGFSALVDLRNANLLGPQTQEMSKHLIENVKSFGLQRTAIVQNSALTGLQSKRIGTETGLAGIQRNIDASKLSDWEQVARDWLERGIDPLTSG